MLDEQGAEAYRFASANEQLRFAIPIYDPYLYRSTNPIRRGLERRAVLSGLVPGLSPAVLAGV